MRKEYQKIYVKPVYMLKSFKNLFHKNERVKNSAISCVDLIAEESLIDNALFFCFLFMLHPTDVGLE